MESWMGPWSSDLPDVSPPEKQLACQRARLYLNTHSNTLPILCACGHTRLWCEKPLLRSLDMEEEGNKTKKIREGSILNVMSTEGLLFVGFRADWLGLAWLGLACLSAEQAFQHHGQTPERNISISETCPPPLHWLFTAPGMHLHEITVG